MRVSISLNGALVKLPVLGLCVVFAGCSLQAPPDPRPPTGGTVYETDPEPPMEETTRSEETSETREGQESNSEEPAPSPQPGTAVESLPTAEKIPGKPGFVYSPFSTEKKPVDVRGLPPGMKAQDPYSNRVFLVP